MSTDGDWSSYLAFKCVYTAEQNETLCGYLSHSVLASWGLPSPAPILTQSGSFVIYVPAQCPCQNTTFFLWVRYMSNSDLMSGFLIVHDILNNHIN